VEKKRKNKKKGKQKQKKKKKIHNVEKKEKKKQKKQRKKKRTQKIGKQKQKNEWKKTENARLILGDRDAWVGHEQPVPNASVIRHVSFFFFLRLFCFFSLLVFPSVPFYFLHWLSVSFFILCVFLWLYPFLFRSRLGSLFNLLEISILFELEYDS
jgi:Flp pilus assembly protein TadB